MHSSKQPVRVNPVWWSVQHTVVWEECRPELRLDLERRKSADSGEELGRLGPDDPLVQHHPTTPRNVGVDRAYAVPDDNWEIGAEWQRIEPALRFGVGARVQYSGYAIWNEQLEAVLREDWDATNAPGTWEKMKRAIRRGFEAARRKPT